MFKKQINSTSRMIVEPTLSNAIAECFTLFLFHFHLSLSPLSFSQARTTCHPGVS